MDFFRACFFKSDIKSTHKYTVLEIHLKYLEFRLLLGSQMCLAERYSCVGRGKKSSVL